MNQESIEIDAFIFIIFPRLIISCTRVQKEKPYKKPQSERLILSNSYHSLVEDTMMKSKENLAGIILILFKACFHVFPTSNLMSLNGVVALKR